MAKSKGVSRFTIDFAVNSDKAAAQIKTFAADISEISKSAKNIDFARPFENVSRATDTLEKDIEAVKNSGDDVEAVLKKMSSTIETSYKAITDQTKKLTYSLTERGKEQREHLEKLKQERSMLELIDGNETQNIEKKRRLKQIEAEIVSIKKDVVDATDDEIRAALDAGRAEAVRLKNIQLEAKNYKRNLTLREKLKSILTKITGDSNKLTKSQEKYNRTLEKTEKIQSKISKLGGVAKRAAKAVGVGIGAVAGIATGALSQADQIAELDRAARRIKLAVSDEDKLALLRGLRIETGGSPDQIVDAINRVKDTIGNVSLDEMRSAAATEIRFPGTAQMLLQTNSGGSINAMSFKKVESRNRALQAATGASVQNIETATNYTRNISNRFAAKASQNDMSALYALLSTSGAFDTEDEVQRAFMRFMRKLGPEDDFWQKVQATDWSASEWSATNKIQARNAFKNVDFDAVKKAAADTSGVVEYSAAEKAAIRARELEDKKNEMLGKLIEASLPLIEALAPSIDKITDGLLNLFEKMIPLVIKFFENPAVQKVFSVLETVLGKLLDVLDVVFEKINAGVSSIFASGSKPAMSSGGLALGPVIAGERGPEIILPLSHSMAGRSSNVQNLYTFNASFNMSGNQTTAGSLSKTLQSRNWGEMMAHSNFLRSRGI